MKKIKDGKWELDLRAVYHYRNRWSWGRIKGTINFGNRMFKMPAGKKGYKRIRTFKDVQVGRERVKNYVPLTQFLAARIGYFEGMDSYGMDKSECQIWDAKICAAAGCKSIWVDPNSRVDITRVTRPLVRV